jgi:adenylate cyclase
MSSKGVKRRLAAILSADVKGYSRLMREDELATINTLKVCQDTIAAIIQQHDGRVVDFTGDNALVEFPSAVNAVNSAVAIQSELNAKNAGLPRNRRMNFRIGINIGDVIEDGVRIFGDGVNIAARIESLADPGGVCLSRQVYDHVKDKLSLSFQYMGPQKVKNIKEPVSVYRVLMEAEPIGKEDDLVDKAADKISVAVMPFKYLGNDSDGDLLCEGITGEIITGLANTPHIEVAALKSTPADGGKAHRAQKSARELDVRYWLEGSIQKSGMRVRISARLVDGERGKPIWADRFDRQIEDIFALQDSITLEIMSALQVKLTHGNHARTYIKGTQNRKAYELILQGFQHFFGFNKDGNILARQLAEAVIDLDPGYPKGYILLAFTLIRDVMFGWSTSPAEILNRAEKLAVRAMEMDRSSATAYALMGNLCLVNHQHERAVAKLEEALNHNPGSADNVALLGIVLNYGGKFKEAVSMFKKSIFLNPKPADWYYHQLAASYLALGKLDRAASAFSQSTRINPDSLLAHAGLAAVYGCEKRDTEAREAANEVLRLDPQFTCAFWTKTLPFLDARENEKLTEAMKRVGLG